MASFGDAGALLNASAPAAAAGVHRAAHVSAAGIMGVRILGNVFSLAAIFAPVWTYVRPVIQHQGVGERTIYAMVGVFYGAAFWIFYAIPDNHRDILTLVVNCLAAFAQLVYMGIYIYHANAEKKRVAYFMMAIFVTFTTLVVILYILMLPVSHVWSAKIAGIVAATISTGMFAVGVVDVVLMFRHGGESPFSKLQLAINLCATCTWTVYSFMFKPPNCYSAVPNATGFFVTTGQLIAHAVHQPADPVHVHGAAASGAAAASEAGAAASEAGAAASGAGAATVIVPDPVNETEAEVEAGPVNEAQTEDAAVPDPVQEDDIV